MTAIAVSIPVFISISFYPHIYPFLSAHFFVSSCLSLILTSFPSIPLSFHSFFHPPMLPSFLLFFPLLFSFFSSISLFSFLSNFASPPIARLNDHRYSSYLLLLLSTISRHSHLLCSMTYVRTTTHTALRGLPLKKNGTDYTPGMP